MTPAATNPSRACAPPRYPAHLTASRRLPDGTAVVIRPIHPDDDAIESAFIAGLSSNSRYNRLLSGRKLTPEETRRLTRIDYEREMAFIAVTVIGARATQLGVARYVRDAAGSGAEFALVVADAWQHKGVGALLCDTLLRYAQAAGIGRMHGITLASNQAMLGLARKFGFAPTRDPCDATVRYVEKALAPGAAGAGAERDAVAANDASFTPFGSPQSLP